MDMASKADKIASARKLLKTFQKKKGKTEQSSSPAPSSEFTILSEPPGPSFIEDAVPVERPPDETQDVQEQPLAQPQETDMTQSSPQLPVFTFPSDGCTSFSEYLGGPAASGPTIAAGSTAPPAFSAAEPPAPPSAALTAPTTEPVPPPGAEEPHPGQPVAEPHPVQPETAAAAAAGGAEEPADSPPGASMASSFTFASSQLSGPGSQGSAASSRHSDWEYVGGQLDSSAPQQSADKLQDPAEVSPAAVPAHLTSETLRQLSDRLSQMTSEGEEADGGDPNCAVPPAADHRLERRNAELAAALEAERRARTEAERNLEDLRARVAELEQDQESGRRAADLRLEQEQTLLTEQTRAQAQTIGILVAEKTELKTATEHLQTQLATKDAECGAVLGRLTAAEERIHQLQEQTSRADQIEVSVQHLQSLYAQADNERNRNRELCSELQEELDEARQRLRSQLDANQALTRQLTDTSSRLELAEIRLTQLGGGGSGSAGAEERAAAAEQEAAQLRAERDAASVQFREYTAALSARLQQAEAARDTLTAELAARDEQAAAAAAAAVTAPPPDERQPSVAAEVTEEVIQAAPPPVTDAERQELEQLRQSGQRAAEETDSLRRELRALNEENTRLTLASQQQAAALKEMEVTVERVSSSAVDNGQLAREMESDRVAASRAMAQNKQLKQQLQELQDGFITLSNKKLELTEGLASERQVSAERTQQLTELQDQLDKMTARAAEADKQNMTAHQMLDQLRHWEAVGRHAETLQADLAAAEEKVSRLESAATTPAAAGTEPAANAPAAGSEPAAPAPAAGSGLAVPERPVSAAGSEPPFSSRTQSPVPRPPLEEVIREREELRARLQQFIGGGAVDPAEHEKLRSALAQLEVRFCEVMSQVAALREERQGLEHLCEQLQGETDTIGEYISLYQVQRSALKQQALERQQELNTLNEDRQQLRQQLGQLQQLVSQLMAGQQPQQQLPPAAEPDQPEVTETVTAVTAAPLAAGRPPPAPDSGSCSPTELEPGQETEPARQQTARRILSLIEQIGANEYMDGHAAPLHVCQHCRGKRVLNV